MTLRGEIEAFPIETVVQLVHSTSKTGQLEVRGSDSTGTLGFDGGRLVAAIAGDDVGEPALGVVFAIDSGSFEFIPWTDAPAANLSGDLDHLLDRAVTERDRIIAVRKVIPDDRSRFRLSERAAERGNITLSPEQWRTLLAVNGERDVKSVAEHLKAARLATRTALAALVESGFIDVIEPAAAAPSASAAAAQAPRPTAAPEQWSPPAFERVAPAPEPQTRAPHAMPAQDWERQPGQPAPQWPAPETDVRADLAAALDARISPSPAAEPETPPTQDERLAALSRVFAAEPAAPEVEAAPSATETARRPDRINEWSRMAPDVLAEPAPEEKKKGLFGFMKREEPAHDATAPMAASASLAPSAAAHAVGRAGKLASLANAMLGEYNGGQYGKGRLDDRMANLLMRVDELADPIDRPLPIVDDRIDAQALDRENVPEKQAVPYLAILVSQIFEDAERTFGKDKAKKGYRAAQQQVFGSDLSSLTAPDVSGRLPKV
jgi:hypothetical protein